MKKILLLILILIPFLLFSWEQIGPAGIKGRDIKIDEATDKIYLLSYDYMHLYKVNEATNEWQEIELPNPTEKVLSFDVYDNRLYVTKNQHLYITENNGETWEDQYFWEGCVDVFILKDNSNIVFLQIYNWGWSRSDDYGNSWTEIGLEWTGEIMYNEEYSLICVFGGTNYFYKSFDLGETWERLECPFYSMSYDPKCGIILDEETFILGGLRNGFTQTVYKTQNGGIDWECINYGSQLALWGKSIVEWNDEIILSSFMSATSYESTGLLRLDQDNLNWEKFGSSLELYLEGTELYSFQNKLYWSTAEEGIFIYEENTETVNLIPDNIFRKDIRDINFRLENPASIFTEKGCLYISDEQNEYWEREDNALFNLDIIQTEENPPQWLTCRSNGLFISDNAEQWSLSMEGIEQNEEILISKLFNLEESILCYARDITTDSSFIYRSEDFGQSWQLVLEGYDNNPETSIKLVNIVKVNDIYLAIFFNRGLFSLNNDGTSWEPLFTFEEEHIYVDGYFNGEYFYLLTGRMSDYKTILYRTDNYTDWYNCTEEFDYETQISAIAFDPDEAQKIYAGIRAFTGEPSEQPHLMISEDAGNTWDEYYINNLDPKTNVNKVYTNTVTNRLYILPKSNSILSCELDELSLQNNTVQFSELKLTNYPNPFNPSTTIDFSIPEDSKVELSIYNIKGQKVRTLINRKIRAGSHNITWNGVDENNKSVSSGIYFYQIQIDDEVRHIRKMMLLK